MRSCPFKEGDLVRLKNGRKPLIVLPAPIHVGRIGKIRVSYCIDTPPTSVMVYHERRWQDFVLHEGPEAKQPKKENEMPTLFATKEITPRYGVQLATDSKGKIVLEMKGGKGVEAFDRSEIEEVLPYTIEAKVVGGSHVCHYRTPEGAVEVGDLLLSDSGNLYRVMKVDTKNRNPKKDFAGSKLTATRVAG